jgi:hypothetical protein
MPFYPTPEEPDFEAVSTTAKAAPDQGFAAAYKTGLDRSPGSAIAATIAGSAVDLLDTAASSVIPGVDRQEINNKFLGAIGSPGLTGWYDKNRGAVEVGSGLLGIVVSDMIAKRVLEPGSLAMKAIRGVPFVGKIATLDAQYERAVRLSSLTTREMAKRGMVGVERFAGVEMNLPALGKAGFTTSGQTASRAVFRTQAAKGLARNLTTEGIMAATLHTNDFLYSDDVTHNIAWSAVGLGIGGAVDSMISAYTLRKVANQDSIRRLNAAAYDVTGLESQRLHSTTIVDDLLRASGADPKDLGFMFTSAGATTDRITSMAISASELQNPRGVTERARALFGKREAIANPQLTMAFEELNKVTTRGLSGVSRAGFGTKLEGLGAPLKESLVREPAVMYGIEEIGTTVDNMTRRQTSLLRDANLDKRFSQVQDLLVNDGRIKRTRKKTPEGEVFIDQHIPLSGEERLALQQEAKELHFKASQVPVTMLEPGEWVPIQLGDLADNYAPRALKEEGGLGADNRKIWSREKEAGEETLGMGSDGELYLPGNGRLESLKTEDVLSLYQIGNKAVRDFVATQTEFVVPKNPNWFQLDLAEQIIKADGGESLIKWPGAMTRQTATVESFAQKVSAIRKREMAIKLANKRGTAESISEAKAYEMKVLFNLPRLTSYQQGLMGTSETPLDMIISGLRSGDDVRKMSHDELVKLVNDARKITQFTEETSDTIESLHGNSFNFLMDRDGVPIKPIVAYKRPLAPTDWTRDELFTRQAMKHSQVRDTLIGEGSDPITKEIVTAIMSNPNAAEARRVMELADDQSRSFVPGFRESAPQTTTGSFMNAITSRERRDADNLIMRAASIVKEDESRITGAVMRGLIENVMGDAVTVVNSPRNVGTKMLLNQVHSFRQGWELVREPVRVELPEGKTGYQFALDHESLNNQARFKRLFDRDLEKGQVLLNPNGTEIVLDELGMDTFSRMQVVHQAEVAMKNTLLRSQNLPEIKVTPWYAPPVNTKGKYIGYTFDVQDNVVSDMTIVADSPEELTKLSNELQTSDAWKPGYSFRQRQAVESFMTLWDKAQMDFVAPNTTALQPKKHNFGRTSGSLMNPNAFDEALVSMRDNMVRHGTDILEVLFDDPLKAARARSKLARVESAVGADQAQHSSVYDRYVQNLLGRNALGAKDSFFGDAFDWAEKRLNGILASPQVMKMGDIFQAMKDFLRTSSPTNPVKGSQFNRLAQELGSYMPYKDAMEMASRETGNRTPKEIAELTSKLSWFEAASRLRWFESMHAVANIGSLIANTPSIIKSLQPMAGETLEQAAKRNSSLVMMMASPDGKQMGLPNVPKLLWTSMKDAWSKKADEFTQKAIRLGYMDQEVAEFQRQWGSIDSKEGWRGFVFGDASRGASDLSGPFKAARAKVANTGGLDKWLGLLSDKSEAFSRQWGMYAGRRVAESMGIHNVDQQIAFAHDLTNKIIANYDPRNRPEIFQGALGAPLGLFQSYVLNYYQRMFRYLETGNARAVATQYAAQAAVFGVGSVPGWSALNWAFFDHQQAEGDDPVDSMYKRFGHADADLIMQGTLSNIPKIFGLDGISLYTRGDAQFRMPVLNLPVADTIKRLWGGLSQGVQQFRDNGGISLNQSAEIASNMITNRPIAGLLEVGAAHGFDTSWDGQVVSQARNTSESIYRILGVRAMRQQKEVEMFYANKNAQEEQNVHKTSLRLATRSAIRDGRYDDLPGLFTKYVEQGGDPRYYTRWVKSSFESALDSRGERQLQKALNKKDNSKNAEIGRLLDSQVDINEDDTASDDYGREAEVDQLVQQGWEGTPDPTEPDPLTNDE